MIDIIGGLALGLGILAIWLSASEYIDSFVVSGQNGKEISFLPSLACTRIVYLP